MGSKTENRKPNRLRYFDYSTPAYYFVTLCTEEFKPYFGKVVAGNVVLNQMGYIANNYWKKIQTLHNDIDIDEYVIMPNHIHGIIIINTTVGTTNFAVPTSAFLFT